MQLSRLNLKPPTTPLVRSFLSLPERPRAPPVAKTNPQNMCIQTVTACVVLSTVIASIDPTTPTSPDCTATALNNLLDSTLTAANSATAHENAANAEMAVNESQMTLVELIKNAGMRRRMVRLA